MKKFLVQAATLAVFLWVAACSKPDLTGLNQEFSSEKPLVTWDSTIVSTATINDPADSLVVSDLSTLTFGSYIDAQFGFTGSDIVFQPVIPPSSTATVYSGDSLILHIHYSGFYGDTTNNVQSADIYELDELLSNINTYHADYAVKYKPNVLKHISFHINTKDSVMVDKTKVPPQLKINLTNTELMTRFSSSLKDVGALTQLQLLDIFKGFYLKAADNPGITGGALARFNVNSLNSKLSFYYKSSSNDTASNRIDFSIGTGGARVNVFRHKYNGTPCEANDSTLCYVQGMAGKQVLVKIDIDNIRKKFPKGSVAINKARLVIPVSDTTNLSKYSAPAFLLLGQNNALNLVEKTFSYSLAYLLNNCYSFNIENRLQDLINHPEEKDYGFLLTLSAYAALDPSRVVLAGGGGIHSMPGAKKSKLYITYTKVK